MSARERCDDCFFFASVVVVVVWSFAPAVADVVDVSSCAVGVTGFVVGAFPVFGDETCGLPVFGDGDVVLDDVGWLVLFLSGVLEELAFSESAAALDVGDCLELVLSGVVDDSALTGVDEVDADAVTLGIGKPRRNVTIASAASDVRCCSCSLIAHSSVWRFGVWMRDCCLLWAA